MLYPARLLLILMLAGTILYAGYFGSSDFAETGQGVENRWVAAAGPSISSTTPGFAFGRPCYDRGLLAAPDWPIKRAAGFQSVFGVPLLFFLCLGLRTRFRLRQAPLNRPFSPCAQALSPLEGRLNS